MKDGEPFMGLSTPGSDQQLLEVFLNVVVWGMSPEKAVDQPRFGSYNFPPTGSEVNSSPAVLNLEDRVPAGTAEALRALGHDVRSWGLWNWRACAPAVTWRDPETGVMTAAGDVRRETASLGFRRGRKRVSVWFQRTLRAHDSHAETTDEPWAFSL